MSTCLRILILSFFASAVSTAHSASLPENFVVEGRLFDTAGAPIAAAVDIQLEVYAEGAPTCVLYREVHSNVNVDSTVNNNNDGVFAVKLGAGTSKPGVFSASSLSSVFANSASVQGDSNGDNAYDCSRTPAQLTSAARSVRVSVRLTSLGGAYDALSPDTTITSVPSAMVAETLQGRDASGFVQTRDDASYDLNQANVESIFSTANFAKLTQLLTGNQGGGTVTNVGTPSAGTDAVNKNYADGSIGGRIADVSTVGPAAGNGHTLIWDQGANRWVTGTPIATDNTKLPLAGGTMTGAIAMGAQNITNIGHMTMAAQRTLNLGTYTTAQESAMTAGLGGADAGKIWYNSDLNANRVWNGTAAVTQPYLNATSKLNPAWLPDTTVTAGAYGSATQVPVFSVGADGRITGVTNTAINAAPTGAAGGDLTGSYPNPTLANDSVETAAIQDGAVSTAKIPDNAIFTAKLRNTGIAVNRLLITNASDGTTVTFATCNIGEAMSWTASGWACTTPAALIGNTGVTAATYGSSSQVAQFQVDAQGRLTSASNVAISYPVISVAGKTGAVTLNVADVSGLGTAAAKDFGNGAGELVELDSSARLPAIDGGNLTNVNAVRLQSRTVASTPPTANQVLAWNASNSSWEPRTQASGGDIEGVFAGAGLMGGFASGSGTLSVDIGTTANKIVQLDSSARMPAVDGSQLANVNAVQLQTRNVSATAPTAQQVLTWNALASAWEPQTLSASTNAVQLQGRSVSAATPSDSQFLAWNAISAAWEPRTQFETYTGTVTSVAGGTGLLGGTITGAGSLSVDVGTTAFKIVQLDSSARLPAVDGGQLTNVNAVRLSNYTVNSTAPTHDQVLTWNALASVWEPKSLPAASSSPVVSVAGKTGSITLDVNDVSGAGDITSVQTGIGLAGGFTSGGGTLSVDVGTTANKIVQLDSSARMPAVDGSQLANVSAVQLQTRNVSATAPTAQQVLTWNALASAWEPQTLSASTNAVQLQGRSVSAATPSDSQFLAWNAISAAWEPRTQFETYTGTVTSVAGGTGLLGGTITGAGSLSVDVGTTAFKIVQLDSSARMPAVDGSQMTNVNAMRLQTRNVSATAPTAQQVLTWNALASAWEPQTLSLPGIVRVEDGSVGSPSLSFNNQTGTGLYYLGSNTLGVAAGGTASFRFSNAAMSSGTANGAFIRNAAGAAGSPTYTFSGNTNVGMYSPGTNQLAFSNGGVETMRINNTGFVGVGTTNPQGQFQVAGNISIEADRALMFNAISEGADQLIASDSAFQIWHDQANDRLRFGAAPAGTGGGAATFTDAMVIASNGNIGMGTTPTTARLHVNGVIRASQLCDTAGSNCKTISGGWTSVTSVGANAPLSSTGGVTPVISIQQASTIQDGYLSSADFNLFDQKLDSTLNSGQIWIGDGTNEPQSRTPSGDVSVSNSGMFTIQNIRGIPLSITAPAVGEYYRYNGTEWAPVTIAIADVGGLNTALNGKLSIANMPASCGSNQTLTFASPGGTWSCSNITIGGGAFGSQSQNMVLASPDAVSGNPTFRALVPNDIPNLSASKINSGTFASTQMPAFTGDVTSAAGSTAMSIASNSVDSGKISDGTITAADFASTVGVWTNNAGNIHRTSGNVGIGTSTPDTQLDIEQNINAAVTMSLTNPNAGSGSSTSILFSNDTGLIGKLLVGSSGAAAPFANRVSLASQAGGAATGVNIMASGTSSDVRIFTGGSGLERMRITDTGSVGIGTTNPMATLDVVGGIRSNVYFEGAAVNAPTTASYTIPDTTLAVRRLTLDTSATITLPNPSSIPANTAYTLTIRVRQDATGGRVISWAAAGATIKWDQSGGPPTPATGANTETIYSFFIIGGETQWYASQVWKEN